MAYSTSNPPRLLTQALGGPGPNIWALTGTDATTVVRVNAYISNARDLGIKKGDLVWYVKTDASPISMQAFIVSAINATGTGDLSDGLAVTATNTD